MLDFNQVPKGLLGFKVVARENFFCEKFCVRYKIIEMNSGILGIIFLEIRGDKRILRK